MLCWGASGTLSALPLRGLHLVLHAIRLNCALDRKWSNDGAGESGTEDGRDRVLDMGTCVLCTLCRYGHGDLQWMTAGSGVVHGEMFPLVNSDRPNPTRFYQIWINLPGRSKMATPAFVMHWGPKVRQGQRQFHPQRHLHHRHCHQHIHDHHIAAAANTLALVDLPNQRPVHVVAARLTTVPAAQVQKPTSPTNATATVFAGSLLGATGECLTVHAANMDCSNMMALITSDRKPSRRRRTLGRLTGPRRPSRVRHPGLKLKMPAQVFCIAGVLTLRSGGHNTLFLAVSHDLTRHKAPMHTPKPPFPPDPVRSIRSHHVHALHIHRASQHILTHRPALCPPQREYGWSVAPFSPSWIVHRAAPRARPPPRHRPRCHFFMIERGCPGQQQGHTGIRAHG